jgi:hypothetical protein
VSVIAGLGSLPASPAGLCARSRVDLAARQDVFGPAAVVRAPASGSGFWRWYAEFVRCGRQVEIEEVTDVAEYPAATGGPALWYSGGVESTFALVQLEARSISPALLHIEDYPVFSGPDRRIGQIHFLCAVVASSLGYGPIYLGMERNDLLLGASEFMRGYVERHPVFADRWSEYQPEHAVLTLCGDWHKEEIISWLHERAIPITGTCDRLQGGAWCGDCYKCFEAYYSAKAVDVDLGIRLTCAAFDRYYGEYRRYVESGFADNFNNAYQHYVRLQVSYGLAFDRKQDCREGAP